MSLDGPPFDLAVVGGGPAGAACALEASLRGLSTLLFEPRRSTAEKPCGEGIMPAGVDAMRDLGLGAAVDGGRPFPGLRHLVAGATPLEVDLPRPGVAVRRGVLCAAFEAAIEAAPSVRRVDWAAAVERVRGGFRLVATNGDPFRATTIVAADGSMSRAAPWLAGDRRRRSPRFGLRARFRERGTLDRVEVHMGRGCEVYLTPLPEREVNVAVLFERPPAGVGGVESLLCWALERHPLSKACLGERTTAPEGRALPCARPRVAAEDGAFLAGDALGAVDPILGCGVTIAVRTGMLAANAALAIVSGSAPREVSREYAAACRRERVARHALASFLRFGDGHPLLARTVTALLRRLPQATRAMAQIAGGVVVVTAEPVAGYAIVAAVAAQRLVEIGVDARNSQRLVERGGVVVKEDETTPMIVFHTAWIASLVAERLFLGARIPSGVPLALILAALGVALALRVWVFATLGRRWTVHVVVIPGERPVTRGPYRFLRHPNYVVVCAEVLLVALLVGAWRTAVVGSLLHVPIVVRRVRCEDVAWQEIAGTSLARGSTPSVTAAPPAPSAPRPEEPTP